MLQTVLTFKSISNGDEIVTNVASKLEAEKVLINWFFNNGGERFYHVVRKLAVHHSQVKRLKIKAGLSPIISIRAQLKALRHRDQMKVIDAFFKHCQRNSSIFYRIEPTGE